MIPRMAVRLLVLLLLTRPLAGQTATRAVQGDFEPGDQILLEVEGDSQFTHIFNVGPGPALTLPVIGAIPLGGVRRANVEAYLGEQLAKYMKHPVVHAKVLVRLGVLGEVEHPGYYAVPAGAVVSDALMAAGGPTKDAKFTGARIEREGKRSEEHTSELQSPCNLVCRLLLEKKKKLPCDLDHFSTEPS